MKNLISLALIFTQLALMPTGYCDAIAPSPSVATPEKALLTKVIAWSGEDLTKAQWQREMREALMEYASSSQPAGRDQRLEQALTDLGIYTPAQAQALIAQASAAGTRVTEQGAPPAEQAVQGELRQLLHTMPEGAQFSACGTPDTALEIAGASASVAGIIGLWAEGGAVPVTNWAGVSILSGISLLIVGYTISISCGSRS